MDDKVMQMRQIIRISASLALLTIILMSGGCSNASSSPGVAHILFEAGYIRALAVSPSGDYLAVGSDTGLHVYQAESGREIWFAPSASTVTTLGFSADGTQIASEEGEAVNVYQGRTGELLATLEFSNRQVSQLIFSPDDNFLALLLYTVSDVEVIIWDIRAGEALLTIADAGWITWGPDSETVGIVRCGAPWLIGLDVWDVGAGEHLYTSEWRYDGPRVTEPCGFYMACGCDVVIGNDGAVYAAEGYWRRVIIWNTQTWEREYEFENEAVVSGIAWSPNGDILAVWLEDGTVILWDVANREAVYTFEGQGSGVYDLTWSLDGSTLAYASGGAIIVWRVGS